MKKNITGMLVSLITVMLFACQPNTTKMLDSYMENRYPNSNFMFDHYDLVSYDKEYYITEVYYSNSQFSDGEIRAHLMLQNNQWVYQDNYLMLLKEKEIREYMQKKAEAEFGTCKVYVHYATSYLPSTFPVTADADEVLDNCSVELIIYLPPSDTTYSEYQNQTDSFWNELLNDQHERVFGTVWNVDSQSVYDNITSPLTSVEMDKYADTSKKVGSFGIFPY